MGKAIYYCVQCSKRVSDSDIESAKGFRVGDRILCADCAPEDVKSVSSKPMPAVTRPKPGSTARTPKVSLPEPPAEAALSPGRRMLVLGGGVFALLLVVSATLLMRTREERAGRPRDPQTPAPSSVSPVAPTPRNAVPDSREAAARAELAKARDFARAHPQDLGGRLKGFRDLILTWDGTEAGRDAAKEADAVRAIIQEKVRGWMAETEEKIAELVKAKQYDVASRKVEELKSLHDLEEWRLAAEKRASELYVLGKKLAEEEEAKKAVDKTAPSPGETPPAKPLSEEGKSQLARWEAAAAKATARDYLGAIADLERSLPALKESDVQAEAAGDVALLRKVASAVETSLGALRQRSRGALLTLQVRDASGAVKRVSGVILQNDLERVELRSGKDTLFVDWSEVAPMTLADLAQKGPFDPRALAALCLLEGEPEPARAFRAELPVKWWTYAERARGRLPKPDPGERAARDVYAAAEAGYRSMDTRSAAIERYRSLRADFAATALVKSYSERIGRRSDAGREYYLAPPDFHVEGTLRLGKSGRLESLKDSDDRDTLLNFAELEFAVLPGQTYRCWIWVGACCEETFLFYYQASELTEQDPKTKKKVAVEPGSGFAVPVKHSLRNLKKTHLEHKPKGVALHPKTPARWEWIEVTLPKYTSPGPKKLRFMTNQAGFSIGGVMLSALRKGPPSEAEIKELEKARSVDDPPMPVDPDLVGWWTFDQAGGAEVRDSSGNGHSGRIVGEVKWIEGKVGGGIRIEGAKSGVEIADAEDLRIPGDLTMALWVRKAAEPTDWVCIMGRGSWDRRNYGLWLDARAPRYMWQQYDARGNKVSDINVSGKKLVEVGKWVQLAATIEQDQVKLYFDGELDNQGKRSAVPWAEAAPLGLGYAMGHSALKGDLDDVRLYRRALSADEIRALYALGR